MSRSKVATRRSSRNATRSSTIISRPISGQKRRSNIIDDTASSRNAPKRRRLNQKKPLSEDKDKWSKMNQQSSIQRRSTRMKYRKLADETQEHRAQIVDPMNKDFMDKLDEQNAIYRDVCHPNEAFMDIEQAKNMTNILKEQTRSLANEQFTITPNDYIGAIRSQFSVASNDNNNDSADEDETMSHKVDWSAIGTRFAGWFLSIPPITFMNGALQQNNDTVVKKKARQVRQKKIFKTDAPLIQPKKISKQRHTDKTETKSRVTHLKKVLRKVCQSQDGVNPFEFLINPNSYSQTIENLFDLSFIMNQGFAQMDVSQHTQQPVLSYVSSSERTRRHNVSRQTNAKNNGQCIIKFNPKTFCSLIDVYQINDSQIQRADDDEIETEDDTTVVTESDSKMNGYKKKGNDKEEAD